MKARLLTCILLAPLPVGAMTLSELAAQATPSVVHLTVLGPSGSTLGNGTGFVIAPDLVATNNHVVDEASGMLATLGDGTEREVLGLLARDEKRDIAIVRVAGGGLVPLTLGKSTMISQGERVVVVGSPRGLSGTLSEGIVSAVRDDGIPDPGPDTPRGRLIQITAAISPGSSGSPVMTFDGEVIGVATLLYTSGQNLNFAVPVEALQRVWDGVDPNAELMPFRPAPWRNLIISIFFFVTLGGGFYVHRRLGKRQAKRRSN